MERSSLATSPLLAALVLVAWPASADVIPAGRRIDWTQTGVPGGIPAWTRVCGAVDASMYGDGKTDATAAIQAAVDGCMTSAPGTSPGPGVVTIPAGTYQLAGSVTLAKTSYLVIRGAGADKTIILTAGSGVLASFAFGSNGVVASGAPIAAGATKGSTSLTLMDASSFSAGQLIDISDDNETGLVFTNHGSTNDSKEMLLVTAKNGNVLTVTPPVIWTFSQSPVVLYGFIGLIQFDGLEDMKIDHSQGPPGASFMFDQCYGCWARGIHSEKPGGYHTYILDSVAGEVRDSFFADSQAYGPDNAGLNVRGTTNAGVNQGAVTGFKFENNIFDLTFPGVEMQNASSGNYIGYNYGYAVQVAVGPMMGDTSVEWNSGMLSDNHGPHDMMNLYEGNIAEQLIADGYFGSSSHGTLFRNYLLGINPRLQISWNAVSLLRWSYDYNIVGNVLGYPGSMVYAFTGDTDCEAGHGIYRLGFPNIGNCGTTAYDNMSPPGLDAQVTATLLRWGNYDYANKAVRFDPSEVPQGVPAPPEALPASLLYTSRPSWWLAGVAWPPIGPDVTGGDGDTSGHVNKTPAQICWENRHLLDGGSFNADDCYRATAGDAGAGDDGGSGEGGGGQGGGTGTTKGAHSGCSCRVPEAPGSADGCLALGALAWLVVRRSRRGLAPGGAARGPGGAACHKGQEKSQ